jgi:hypothetical protein
MDEELCTLLGDDYGRVMDRLAALEQLITPHDLQQALHQARAVPRRACVLTNTVMLWVVLAMGLFTALPIRRVFKACRRLHRGEGTPGRSALCLARRRLGVAPIRCLFERIVRPLATPQTPGAFYRGLRLVAVDATVEDVPDSDANARAFGRPSGRYGDGAFPQIRKLSLVETGTHAELAFVVKGIRAAGSGEQSMLPALLRHLREDMLLLWDRGFFSYALWQQVRARGTHLLVRGRSTLIVEPIRELRDGSYLARVYPNENDRHADRNGIVVRVICYTLDDPQRVGHGEEHVLLTSLLDETAHPALTLILLYHERWEAELVYDEQKTHQDPQRASKPAQLRSETPAGVMQELYALSLGHYVVRALMVQAAATVGLDPDRLSFTGCFQILQLRLPECPSGPPTRVQRWLEDLLWELSCERTEPRQNRINPRVLKRPTKPFPRKRPEHRGRPPLQHLFVETIVMIR